MVVICIYFFTFMFTKKSDGYPLPYYVLPPHAALPLAWCALLIAMCCKCLLTLIELIMGGQSGDFTLSPLKSRLPLQRFILTLVKGTDSIWPQANS